MRTLQGVTYPAYYSLRKTARTPGGKKLKTTTTGAQEIKTITKYNSRCISFNAEWNSKTAAHHQKPIPPLRI
jgi:hypothetical protein